MLCDDTPMPHTHQPRDEASHSDRIMPAFSDSSPPSKETRGFEFNGTTYHTYNEMVSAKRERNRSYLKQKLSEISSGSVASCKRKRNSSGISSVSSSIQKKKGSSPSATSSHVPVRRNPRRAASSNASSCSKANDNSSLSSNSSPRKTATIEDENVVIADLKCSPQEVDIKEKVKKHKGKKDEQYVSNLLDNQPIERDVEPPRKVKVVSKETVSVPDSIQIKGNLLPLEVPGQQSRARGCEAENLLSIEDVKDISAHLEYIIGDGVRVKKREIVWKEFCVINWSADTVDSFKDIVEMKNRSQKGALYAVDRRLYTELSNDHYDQQTHGRDSNFGFNTESDDELIPKEYQIPSPNPKYMDRLWIEEYGDGLDPTLFEDKYLSFDNDVARQYTSNLLRRCWERAVGEVSNTIPVNVNKNESEQTPETQDSVEKDVASKSARDQRSSVASDLHSSVMNTVDSLIDLLLVEKNELFEKISSETDEQSRPTTWLHIAELLMTIARSSGANPITLFDESSLKEFIMRLVDRYGTVSQHQFG